MVRVAFVDGPQYLRGLDPGQRVVTLEHRVERLARGRVRRIESQGAAEHVQGAGQVTELRVFQVQADNRLERRQEIINLLL